jgi:nuclear pore complex protein Nup98-Nup96
MTRLPELIQDLRASQDGLQLSELEELARGIPKLIGVLPAMVRDPTDARQNVAVTTMINALTLQLDKALPLTLVRLRPLSFASPLTPAPEPQTTSRPTGRRSDQVASRTVYRALPVSKDARSNITLWVLLRSIRRELAINSNIRICKSWRN